LPLHNRTELCVASRGNNTVCSRLCILLAYFFIAIFQFSLLARCKMLVSFYRNRFVVFILSFRLMIVVICCCTNYINYRILAAISLNWRPRRSWLRTL